MDIIKKLAEELAIKDSQVKATVDLIDEGNTIPFISRYRKEATGGLNDEVLRTLDERLTYLRGLEERKATVVKSIEEQGKMTPELMKQIEDASTLVAVEDLYRPYKPKRRTRATVAKEKGLEPLAQQILAQEVSVPLEQLAEAYVSEEKGVASAAEALAGASDILAGYYCEVDGDDHIRMDQHELRYAEWVKREDIILQNKRYSLTNEMMERFKLGIEK